MEESFRLKKETTEKPPVLFHGSVTIGIKELEPRRRFVPEKSEGMPGAIYAGDLPAFAAAHAFPWESKEGFELSVEAGQVVFRVPEQFRERLMVPISIYSLSSDTFEKTAGEGTGHTYHTTQKTVPIETEEFPSVEEAIVAKGGRVEFFK